MEHATSDLYNALVERIASGTRFAARSRGSRAVTERDFAAGITTEITNPFAPSPADVLPEHYYLPGSTTLSSILLSILALRPELMLSWGEGTSIMVPVADVSECWSSEKSAG